MELINANVRNKKVNHAAKKNRKNGLIPGIIYGKNVENTLFEIGELELQREIAINGEHGILEINIDGEKHKTLIKEIQKDPIKHKIIHIDLEDLSGNRNFTTEVPLNFNGESNIRKFGGILQKSKDSVKIRCQADNLPKSIDVDVSNLSFGDTLRIADIEASSEISIIDDLNSIVVTVTGASGGDIPDEGNEEAIDETNENQSSTADSGNV
ncbi:50S ribosomal protein L25 [Clostridium pasteurianum DSM 525 = ATCC 6013]|uniref:Large ribosomal subunit protein bL25 n=1 Tax=Clostridium pasteurianum DSM 525 = ATCC 6013 TaxID=1262449 RepID=A0A0H3J1K0_CLOPA|nr:50S ribosomal protein L25 [Clostridium pasteurianum]AJA47761.1 50S ribosomal protein L25 [Clostridium pasteurianum DSM 525 = ATCC 6013]AJA51749.1 50S ribosomal protein L25 [Clostridium pasteurianum DSM 525 = ATCC 6013]AOZ75059.1 50S ribosomal protein L25 [Clostridium pasteurianum DSM 525 = ATCC 6013]AOZ78854.1 50S ribosomal protein L25 [Clostridium pasteurianum]ELP59663.1 50S ribosomal protein L25/general stress protein Ctc [Clostridium pasteurianum DSM 525 = ATCC 6013]